MVMTIFFPAYFVVLMFRSTYDCILFFGESLFTQELLLLKTFLVRFIKASAALGNCVVPPDQEKQNLEFG